MANLPAPIQPGSLFDYRALLVEKPRAALYSIKIYDPNQRTTIEFSRPIKTTDSIGMFNSVIFNCMNSLDRGQKTEMSVKHNVLCNLTSLIAFEKISTIDYSKKAEFVKIPLNTALKN
jgi:ABC-type dipeptide/oligopeptide/nickel transport system ATPase subunit